MPDTHHLGRRSVLAAGVASLGASWLMTSCTGAASTPVLPAAAHKGAPARGGTLRIARPAASDAETLNPASSLSAYEYLGALYNRLVRIGPDGMLAPDLAESWEPDDKAATWTFRLRKGVTFHDGRAFTAADAAYTLRHILDKATASPQAAVLAPLDPNYGGSRTYPDGLRYEESARETYRIRHDDPLSARAVSEWPIRLRRGDDWDAEIMARTELRATAADFVMDSRIEARANGETVAERAWHRTTPRTSG
ncbi:ABC transporter substrate-binding protein [Streptomyces sp. NPDC088817]|uniref:ABC transporter substrate-binding protein n=1 Tax=Streptomyces sp. NPDC088817 TaxID=3365907 RepID=UPI00380D0AA2